MLLVDSLVELEIFLVELLKELVNLLRVLFLKRKKRKLLKVVQGKEKLILVLLRKGLLNLGSRKGKKNLMLLVEKSIKV